MSAIGTQDVSAPVFKAVSSTARQLFQLLNCIRFSPKAQVKITEEGITFTVEESRVMQGKSSRSIGGECVLIEFRNCIS